MNPPGLVLVLDCPGIGARLIPEPVLGLHWGGRGGARLALRRVACIAENEREPGSLVDVYK